MTSLLRVDDLFRVQFFVNGCLSTEVTDHEMRIADDLQESFEVLAMTRIAPLIWLAMPGHDLPAP
jgi:hypothetical protein